MMLKSIGAKVSLMLPTEKCWDLIKTNDIVVVLPFDTKKWKKDKEYNRYRDFFIKNPKIEYEKIDIKNSGFILSIFPDYGEYGFSVTGKQSRAFLIKIKHPELEKYPFTIATYIECRNFFPILGKSGNVINGTLSGNFCCLNRSGISGIYSTIFDIEDPEDEIMSNGKNLGKIISEGKRTTKWKVGYKYVTVNERCFIYLGDFVGGWFISRDSSGFGNYIISGFNSLLRKNLEPVPLIVEINNNNKELEDLINFTKGGLVSTFIVSYLSSLVINSHGYHYYDSHFRTINKLTHPAIEMEKIFDDDKTDLKKLFINFYTSRFPSYEGCISLVNFKDLDKEGRKKFDEKIIDIVKDYIGGRNKYYYSKKIVDPSITKDPEKLLDFLKKNRPTYFYYEIYGVLDYLGDEEFKNIISKCSF